MDFYYWDSPHKQIFENFEAKVVKVVDGDTIIVSCDFRNFNFPIRFLNTNAPEMNEGGGEAKSWLEDLILHEDVEIIIDKKQRVGKWGRLLGVIFHDGININKEIINAGMSTTFDARHEGQIQNIDKVLGKWD